MKGFKKMNTDEATFVWMFLNPNQLIWNGIDVMCAYVSMCKKMHHMPSQNPEDNGAEWR